MYTLVVHRDVELSREAARRYALVAAVAERKAAGKRPRRRLRLTRRFRAAVTHLAR